MVAALPLLLWSRCELPVASHTRNVGNGLGRGVCRSIPLMSLLYVPMCLYQHFWYEFGIEHFRIDSGLE